MAFIDSLFNLFTSDRTVIILVLKKSILIDNLIRIELVTICFFFMYLGTKDVLNIIIGEFSPF